MVWLSLWAMQLMSLALQAPPLMLPAVVLLLVALARS
jgi:type IV secretory pathway TrbL component